MEVFHTQITIKSITIPSNKKEIGQKFKQTMIHQNTIKECVCVKKALIRHSMY